METKEEKTEVSNEQLVEEAGRAVIGTPSGLVSQRAQAELARRLMESIRDLDTSTGRYSRVIIALTLCLGLLAYLQLMVGIFSLPLPPAVQVAVLLLFVCALAWGFYKVVHFLD